jgi:CRISPR-associated protein (Cas_Csa4).
MRYYTPGHGIVTDALILHGLLKMLHLRGRFDGYVQIVGGRFLVDVPDGVDLAVLERWELRELLEMAANGIYAGKLRELQLSAIDIAGFKKWASSLLDAYLDLPRFFDLSENHRESRREGRSRSKKAGGGYTLYLPISSVYGKYVGRSYGLKEEAYTACASCFALSTIGYIYGALKLRVERNDGFAVFNFAFIPRSKMSVRDLLLLQRLSGYLWIQKRGAPSSLNVAGALIYALSVGETLYAAGGRPAVVVWITERSGNNQRSHRPSVLDVDVPLRFVAELKLEVPQWPVMASFLVSHEPVVLNALGEYVLFGGDAYAVARQMLSALRNPQLDAEGKERARKLMKHVEKITNVLLNTELWSLK